MVHRGISPTIIPADVHLPIKAKAEEYQLTWIEKTSFMKRIFFMCSFSPHLQEGGKRASACFLSILLLFLLMIVLSACGKQSNGSESTDRQTRSSVETVTVHQPDGTELKVPFRPQRTLVCYSSLVQLWDASGGNVIGFPNLLNEDTIPEKLRNLPRIGSFSSLDMEKILSLNPDFVLLMDRLENHRSVGEILKQLGIPALRVQYRNYHDFLELMKTFSRINGTSSCTEVQDQVDRILKTVPKSLEAPRFYVLFAAGRGIYVEGPSANTACMAEMLGGKNLAGEFTKPRIPFSLEQIVLDDPDVIFFVTMGESEEIQRRLAGEFLELPVWQKLSAVQNKRVHFLPNELFLYLPGLRYPEAFLILRNLLYPEQTVPADFNLKEEPNHAEP